MNKCLKVVMLLVFVGILSLLVHYYMESKVAVETPGYQAYYAAKNSVRIKFSGDDPLFSDYNETKIYKMGNKNIYEVRGFYYVLSSRYEILDKIYYIAKVRLDLTTKTTHTRILKCGNFINAKQNI